MSAPQENFYREENKPIFSENGALEFFSLWCEKNGNFIATSVPRDRWNMSSEKGIFGKDGNGKNALILPGDLKLYEIPDIIEKIEQNSDFIKPPPESESAEKIRTLGKTFRNAGILIASRLNAVREGKDIAENMAERFFAFGESLASGKKSEPAHSSEIASRALSSEEAEDAERFLAGKNLYDSRAEKMVSGHPDEHEQLFEKTLAQFFRAADTAKRLSQKTNAAKGEESFLQKNQKTVHDAFLTNAEKRISEKINEPKTELTAAVFQKGMRDLLSGMKEPSWKHSLNSFFNSIGMDPILAEKTLAEQIDLPRLKRELEETRRRGNIAEISQKEKETADVIQLAVSQYKYEKSANNPAEILQNQFINCVGASMLGGTFMKEAGLSYLVGDLPEHSILFLVLEDGTVEWRDMLTPNANMQILPNELKNPKTNSSLSSVSDIIQFSKNPNESDLLFVIEPDAEKKYRPRMGVKKNEAIYARFTKPELGQKFQALNNLGATLSGLKQRDEAIAAYREAIAIDSNFYYPHIGLGNRLYEAGKFDEAFAEYVRAVKIAPFAPEPYLKIGKILLREKEYAEAAHSFEKAIECSDTSPDAHLLLSKALSGLGENDGAAIEMEKYSAMKAAEDGPAVIPGV